MVCVVVGMVCVVVEVMVCVVMGVMCAVAKKMMCCGWDRIGLSDHLSLLQPDHIYLHVLCVGSSHDFICKTSAALKVLRRISALR